MADFKVREDGQQRSPTQLARWIVLAAVILAILSYASSSLRIYRASRWSNAADVDGLRRAIRLRPSNAEYHARLALALDEGAHFEGEKAELQEAVRLDSHQSMYWLELARVADNTGDSTLHSEALARAVANEPTNPRVLWEAANYHLASQNITDAVPILRRLLTYDLHSDNNVAAAAVSSGLPAQLVLNSILPARVAPHLAYLQRLVLRGRTPDAKLVWERLIALHQPVDPQAAAPFFDVLLDAHDVPALQRSWAELAASNPDMQAPAEHELITNADFENTLTNTGLDWRFSNSAPGRLAIDTSEFQSGLRSLRITFDEDQRAPLRFYQLVPVAPLTHYSFRSFARTEELLSVSGPRIAIRDAYTDQELATTEELSGTHSWHPWSVDFATGPDTRLIKIAISRISPSAKIRGRIWLDGVSLRRKPVEN